jgi:hypothetical protein
MTKLEWRPKGLLITRLKTRSYHSVNKGDVIRKQFQKIKELKEKQKFLIKDTKIKERIIKGRVKEVVRLNKKLNSQNQSQQMNRPRQAQVYLSPSNYLKFGDFDPISIETLTSSLESLSIIPHVTAIQTFPMNSLQAQSQVSVMKESVTSQTSSSDLAFIPEFFLKSNNEVSPRLEDLEDLLSHGSPNEFDYYDNPEVQQACHIFKDDLDLGNSKMVVLHTDSDTTYSFYNDDGERCRLVHLDVSSKQLSNDSYKTTKSTKDSNHEAVSTQQDYDTSPFKTCFGEIKDFDIIEDVEYGVSFFYDPCDCTHRMRVMTARFLKTLNLRYKECDAYLPVKWLDGAYLFNEWRIQDWRNKFRDFALHFDDFDPNTNQELDSPGSEFATTKEGTEELSNSDFESVFESED